MPGRRLISVTAVQGERLALSLTAAEDDRSKGRKRLQVAGGAGACLRSRTRRSTRPATITWHQGSFVEPTYPHRAGWIGSLSIAADVIGSASFHDSCHSPTPARVRPGQHTDVIKYYLRLRDVLTFHTPIIIRFLFRKLFDRHECRCTKKVTCSAKIGVISAADPARLSVSWGIPIQFQLTMYLPFRSVTVAHTP